MDNVNTKTQNMYKYVYGIILPILTCILLLGVASIINRAKIGGNIIDLLIRIFLTLYIGSAYKRLSSFSTFSFYPNRKWTKNDIGKFEKYYLILMGIFCGFGFGILTWWTIALFFSSNLLFLIVGSSINWIIISYPITTQYWVIKMW